MLGPSGCVTLMSAADISSWAIVALCAFLRTRPGPCSGTCLLADPVFIRAPLAMLWLLSWHSIVCLVCCLPAGRLSWPHGGPWGIPKDGLLGMCWLCSALRAAVAAGDAAWCCTKPIILLPADADQAIAWLTMLLWCSQQAGGYADILRHVLALSHVVVQPCRHAPPDVYHC
jgi:hypothetical protein